MVEQVRDWEKFEGTLRDYATWLGQAVPGASDLDFVCERRKQFFVIEAKPMQSAGVYVGFGQHLMLSALAELESFSVYLVGEDQKKEALYVRRYEDRAPVKNRTRPVFFEKRTFLRTTREGLQAIVGEWYKEASGN